MNNVLLLLFFCTTTNQFFGLIRNTRLRSQRKKCLIFVLEIIMNQPWYSDWSCDFSSKKFGRYRNRSTRLLSIFSI